MSLEAALFFGLGAALGAVSRWGVSGFQSRRFPWATLLVNIVGSALLGAGVVRATGLALATITGFCGAFTTFSSFAVEVVELRREGRSALALTYMLVTVTACPSVLYFVALAVGA